MVVVGRYLACPAGAGFQPCPSSALYLLLCAGTQFLPARRSFIFLRHFVRTAACSRRSHQFSTIQRTSNFQGLSGRAWIGREQTAVVYSLIDTEEQRDVVPREGDIMKHIVSRNLLFLLLLVPCLPDDQVCPLSEHELELDQSQSNNVFLLIL